MPQPGKFPVLIDATLHPTVEADVKIVPAVPDMDAIVEAYLSKVSSILRLPSFSREQILAFVFVSMAVKFARSQEKVPVLPALYSQLHHMRQELPTPFYILINLLGEFQHENIRYCIKDGLNAVTRCILAANICLNYVRHNTTADANARTRLPSMQELWDGTLTATYDESTDSITWPVAYNNALQLPHVRALNTWYSERENTINVESGFQGNTTTGVIFMMPHIPEQDYTRAAFRAMLASTLPTAYLQALAEKREIVQENGQSYHPRRFETEALISEALHERVLQVFVRSVVPSTAAGAIAVRGVTIDDGIYRLDRIAVSQTLTESMHILSTHVLALRPKVKTLSIEGFDSSGSAAQLARFTTESEIECHVQISSSDQSAAVYGSFIGPPPEEVRFKSAYQDRSNVIRKIIEEAFSIK